jgi:hypothetical protein
VITQHHTDTLVVENGVPEEHLRQKIADLEKYKGKSKALDLLIEEVTIKLKQLEEEAQTLIDESKGNDQKRNELHAKLADLDETAKQLLSPIEVLLTQNKTLKKKKLLLSADLYFTEQDKSDLQETINECGIIHIEYMNVTTLKKKLLGKKMIPSSSAWQVSRIRTCFRIMDNPLATPGSKVIFLRIVSPDSTVLVNAPSGAMKFKDRAGKIIEYTGELTIHYTGELSDQCIDYTAPYTASFNKGKYKVEVYMDGVLMASSSAELK